MGRVRQALASERFVGGQTPFPSDERIARDPRGQASGGGMASHKWVSRQRGVISHQIPFPRGGVWDRTEACLPGPLGATTGGNGTW